jgi:microsomal dipeptidase-like Zn-dependent dipeptidase
MKKKKVQVQTDEALFSSLAKRCFNKAKRCDSITARGGLRELGRQYLEIAKKVAVVADVSNAADRAVRAERANQSERVAA